MDHPRSRGVYTHVIPADDAEDGSSPLARGLHPIARSVADGLRIIPARAGFTSPDGPGPARSRDHPRSRGVYVQVTGTGTFQAGSSPLARGLQTELLYEQLGWRIIPARAGFTSHAA